MIKSIIVVALLFVSSPTFAQIDPPTCDELRAAYNVITEVTRDDYVDRLAQVFFDNNLMDVKDKETTLPNLKETLEHDSKRDPFKFVMFLTSDLIDALDASKCSYEKRDLKVWE